MDRRRAAGSLLFAACGSDDGGDDSTDAAESSSTDAAESSSTDAAESSNGDAATDESATGYGFDEDEQDPDASITVWVDATREPLANAFIEAYPDVPFTIETYDGNAGGSDSLRTQVALFDQAGEGWPDVVFSTQVNDASWASQPLTPNSEPWAALFLFSQRFLVQGTTAGGVKG